MTGSHIGPEYQGQHLLVRVLSIFILYPPLSFPGTIFIFRRLFIFLWLLFLWLLILTPVSEDYLFISPLCIPFSPQSLSL
jgi:hypothetical protein